MEFLVKIIKHEVVTIPVEADDASEAEEIAFRLASNDKIDPSRLGRRRHGGLRAMTDKGGRELELAWKAFERDVLRDLAQLPVTYCPVSEGGHRRERG